jgi:hypothetical protein
MKLFALKEHRVCSKSKWRKNKALKEPRVLHRCQYAAPSELQLLYVLICYKHDAPLELCLSYLALLYTTHKLRFHLQLNFAFVEAILKSCLLPFFVSILQLKRCFANRRTFVLTAGKTPFSRISLFLPTAPGRSDLPLYSL